MTTVDTFAPHEVCRRAQFHFDTDWIVPDELAEKASVTTLQSIVALRRSIQPTGGLDGGALNRLLTQALTGYGPEE